VFVDLCSLRKFGQGVNGAALTEDSARTAVKEFAELVFFTRDGVSLADQGYFERRLFDKLLVCEGERIEELLLAAR